MARAYTQLRKRSQTRTAARTPRTNFVARLAKLEEMVFEINSRLVREAKEREKNGSLSEWDTDILQAAEEFRAHLTEVLKNG